MIVLVLKSGGPHYGPDDVAQLVRQIRRFSDERVVCLSDCEVECDRIPLAHGWPGWWSKMELFRPELAGDFLYMDLDTIVRGPLDDLLAIGNLALLRDFYRADGLGSGLMVLPEAARAEVWREWIRDPGRWMGECVHGGDQMFIERFWLDRAARLQDVVPGQITSFKAHTRDEQLASRVVCFHGEPKPRDVRWCI